jgi:UDP-N-acetylmuramoylalanine--D-glutamate ligase
MTIDPRHPFLGTRPLVVGAARSGIAAARLLARHGLDVVVCDAKPESEAPEAARALAEAGVTVRWQGDTPAALEGRDVVVWSPGIAIEHPIARVAEDRNLPVLSELELGFLAAGAPLVCVTGTNGKSTTTDLIGHLLRAGGREVAVCGNIGRPICEVAESVSASGLLVVEVSSFQLETVSRLVPFVAVWLNLTPDHLDRHRTLDQYGALKRRLFERQTEEDYAVWNADDPEVTARRAGGGTPLEFSARRAVDQGAYAADGDLHLAWRGGRERLMPASELGLLGPHNRMNVLAALAATLPLEIAPPLLRETLRGYRGLEHRLETVATIDGVRFVNDSKATNAGSLEVALQSFDRPVVLIAGGRHKEQDFTPLRERVARTVRALVLIGEAQDRMAAAWPDVPAHRAATLAEAVETAYREARSGGAVVLLSPGCASFDMFRDYEDRGRRFKAEVERLRIGGGLAA